MNKILKFRYLFYIILLWLLVFFIFTITRLHFYIYSSKSKYLILNEANLNRSSSDPRTLQCKRKLYTKYLPTASVIIIFHNEDVWMVLRTVWSVINRSPNNLLKEILLVNDDTELKSIEMYLKTLPQYVHYLKRDQRMGIVRARLYGAQHAQGDVLVFLDAHCECSNGWLEPLLARITNNRQVIVSPQIDVISSDTFDYQPTPDLYTITFSWDLTMKWTYASQSIVNRYNNDSTTTIPTNIIVGCVFAVDRLYFYEIGSYDDRMRVWGTENIELSVRVWMCGGSVEIATCSHVGHLFKHQEYTFPFGRTDTVLYNNVRMIEVWFDEWKQFYYSESFLAKEIDPGYLLDRIELRKQLQCNTFEWYLLNIHNEWYMPVRYQYFGYITNSKFGYCLDVIDRYTVAGILPCHNLSGNQLFMYTNDFKIVNNNMCLNFNENGTSFVDCYWFTTNNTWIYNQLHQQFVFNNTALCLQANNRRQVGVGNCSKHRKYQRWLINNPYHWQAPNFHVK